jgi:hypothetical protein
MRTLILTAAVLSLLPMLTACPELRALNDQMERNMAQHPLGPLGPGLDMYTAGEQIRAARGR